MEGDDSSDEELFAAIANSFSPVGGPARLGRRQLVSPPALWESSSDDDMAQVAFEENGGEKGALSSEKRWIGDEPDGRRVRARARPRMIAGGKYVSGAKLGSGTSATVVEALNSQTLRVTAAKIVDTKKLRRVKGGIDNLKREILVHRSLKKHPNLIELLEVYRDEPKNRTYLFLEMANGCAMDALLERSADGKLAPEQVAHYVYQVLKALAYMHGRGCVHRDVKPGNMLLTADGVVKLADFGVSERLDLYVAEDNVTRTSGSPAFQAPEIARGDEEYSGMSVDVWAMGVSCYQMLTGEVPFQAANLAELFKKISAGKFAPLDPNVFEKQTRDCVERMLVSDWRERASTEELLGMFWISSAAEPPLKAEQEKQGWTEIPRKKFTVFELAQQLVEEGKVPDKPLDSSEMRPGQKKGPARPSVSSIRNMFVPPSPSEAASTKNTSTLAALKLPSNHPLSDGTDSERSKESSSSNLGSLLSPSSFPPTPTKLAADPSTGVNGGWKEEGTLAVTRDSFRSLAERYPPKVPLAAQYGREAQSSPSTVDNTELFRPQAVVPESSTGRDGESAEFSFSHVAPKPGDRAQAANSQDAAGEARNVVTSVKTGALNGGSPSKLSYRSVTVLTAKTKTRGSQSDRRNGLTTRKVTADVESTSFTNVAPSAIDFDHRMVALPAARTRHTPKLTTGEPSAGEPAEKSGEEESIPNMANETTERKASPSGEFVGALVGEQEAPSGAFDALGAAPEDAMIAREAYPGLVAVHQAALSSALGIGTTPRVASAGPEADLLTNALALSRVEPPEKGEDEPVLGLAIEASEKDVASSGDSFGVKIGARDAPCRALGASAKVAQSVDEADAGLVAGEQAALSAALGFGRTPRVTSAGPEADLLADALALPRVEPAEKGEEEPVLSLAIEASEEGVVTSGGILGATIRARDAPCRALDASTKDAPSVDRADAGLIAGEQAALSAALGLGRTPRVTSAGPEADLLSDALALPRVEPAEKGEEELFLSLEIEASEEGIVASGDILGLKIRARDAPCRAFARKNYHGAFTKDAPSVDKADAGLVADEQSALSAALGLGRTARVASARPEADFLADALALPRVEPVEKGEEEPVLGLAIEASEKDVASSDDSFGVKIGARDAPCRALGAVTKVAPSVDIADAGLVAGEQAALSAALGLGRTPKVASARPEADLLADALALPRVEPVERGEEEPVLNLAIEAGEGAVVSSGDSPGATTRARDAPCRALSAVTKDAPSVDKADAGLVAGEQAALSAALGLGTTPRVASAGPEADLLADALALPRVEPVEKGKEEPVLGLAIEASEKDVASSGDSFGVKIGARDAPCRALGASAKDAPSVDRTDAGLVDGEQAALSAALGLGRTPRATSAEPEADLLAAALSLPRGEPALMFQDSMWQTVAQQPIAVAGVGHAVVQEALGRASSSVADHALSVPGSDPGLVAREQAALSTAAEVQRSSKVATAMHKVDFVEVPEGSRAIEDRNSATLSGGKSAFPLGPPRSSEELRAGRASDPSATLGLEEGDIRTLPAQPPGAITTVLPESMSVPPVARVSINLAEIELSEDQIAAFTNASSHAVSPRSPPTQVGLQIYTRDVRRLDSKYYRLQGSDSGLVSLSSWDDDLEHASSCRSCGEADVLGSGGTVAVAADDIVAEMKIPRRPSGEVSSGGRGARDADADFFLRTRPTRKSRRCTVM